MNLRALLFSVAGLALITAHAQDWNPEVYRLGEKYPGYIIDADGKKTEGYIELKDRYSMQNDVEFYTDKDDKKTKQKLKSKDLKEYQVADKLYRCINYSGGLSGSAIRGNLVVEDGCITQYVWYNRAENYMIMQQGANESHEEFMARMYPSVMVFHKEGDDKPRSVDYFGLKFPQKMSEYVADNADLARKVADKEKGYGMLRILEIVQEYNASCTPGQ
ncbi:MAG: hypothetical protein R2810_09555 [Flavobacteriales bacterium]|nr:hypothetical protein [Flavobacteriales bacterium]MCB9180637.1 hypothetical protein [Flavobacteriales bacterium]HOP43530.1 hypothetical protein [Flavobacteriales bacterium]HPF66244.1 hypothetical protein [Flavobacteriales bacterium]HPJ52408.1 hypothetical protein [Flavobacteriales bacterium]